jgi:aspartate kinase
VTSGPAPVVYKFGGTSLGDGVRIAHVAGLVAAGPRPLAVVVSAMAGVTDLLQGLALADTSTQAAVDEAASALTERHLAALAALHPDGAAAGPAYERTRADIEIRIERLADDATGRTGLAGRMRADAVLSTGEDLSQRLLLAALEARDLAAAAVDSRNVVVTDARFGRAVPDRAATRKACAERLLPVLREGTVAVLQGFVAATPDGHTTTLGRGGSDFSAAILGGALDADTVHIWTDVQGVLSGDPRQVDAPRLLPEIGFEELVELAWAGARVIHPVAAKWAVAEGAPLRIRDTFHPEDPGTRVLHDARGASEIAAITTKPGVALIKVRSHPVALPYGFLARVFGVLGRHRLEVDLVATSHSSTAFTIDDRAHLTEVEAELGTFADVDVRRELATITVVGRGLMAEPGVDGQVFAVVGATRVHLVSQASDVSLSLVVDAGDADALTRKLHDALIGPERRTEATPAR